MRWSPATQQVAMPSPASPDMNGSTTPSAAAAATAASKALPPRLQDVRAGGGGERVRRRRPRRGARRWRAMVLPGPSFGEGHRPQATATQPSRRGSAPPVIAPGVGVDGDALHAADQRCVQSAGASTSWPRSRSASSDAGGADAALGLHPPAVPQPRPRRLDGVLQRQPEIDVLHQRLRLGLADAVAARRAERQHRPAVAGGDRGRHRQREVACRGPAGWCRAGPTSPQ